jgi:hypothetical protein
MAETTTRAAQPEVSLCQTIETRDGTLTKDARMTNAFRDPTSQGQAFTKRPGTSVAGLAQPPLNQPPQGTLTWNFRPIVIQGDVLYDINSGATWAIPSVTTAGQQYSTLSDVPPGESFLKSADGLWRFDGSSVTKVTDVNYPAQTVPGIVYLDGTYYVMDTTGNVRASAFEDPSTWPPLQFIQADFSLGAGAGISRHLNYICAFYVYGLQLYYDAGNSPGIPLSPVGNAAFTTGCAHGRSIQEITDTTFYIARNKQFGKSVQMIQGLQCTVISTPPIERVLNRSNFAACHSWAIKTVGHTFYGITLPDIGITLVYDTITQDWAHWTSFYNGNEQFFSCINYLNDGVHDLFQDLATGHVVAMLPTNTSDVTGQIVVHSYTPNLDWGNMDWKRFAAVYLMADTQAAGSQLFMQYSDDDYQTFSALRAIDMSSVRKMLQRCGRSRRRAFSFLYVANTPLKVYSAQFDMSMGPAA